MARRRSKYTAQDVDQVTMLRAEGLGWTEVAKQLNLTAGQCELAYEEGLQGDAGLKRTSKLMKIFQTLQDRVLTAIESFTEDEIKQLSPNQRAILFGIMADKIGPLMKVLGERLGADHLEEAPTIMALMGQAQGDLAEVGDLAERIRKKLGETNEQA